jgi:hypothetical protein
MEPTDKLYELLIKIIVAATSRGIYPRGCGSEQCPCKQENYPKDMTAWDEVKPGILKRNKYGEGQNDAISEISFRILDIIGEVCPETSEEGKKLWDDIEKFEEDNPTFWKIKSSFNGFHKNIEKEKE